jgi:hypothetical protein
MVIEKVLSALQSVGWKLDDLANHMQLSTHRLVILLLEPEGLTAGQVRKICEFTHKSCKDLFGF